MVFKTVASSSKTVVDMTDAYTVALSNESVAIACDVAGTALAGELGSGGKATSSLAVYKGPIALTPVTAGATPTVGQYKYVIGTAVGSTPLRLNDSTFYINAVSADTGSVLVTIYLEGLLLSITKTLTWNKSKTGATGKAVTSIVEEYYNSTSSTGQAGDSWGTAVPAWVNGRYLWTRTKTTFSDTNTSTTAPICVSGQKGLDGTIYYMWVKYADNADGTIGLSDSPAGKRYIGVAANQTSSTEGTTPEVYTWSPLYDNVVVGGTNLWLDSSPEKSLANWTVTDGTKTLDATMLWEGKPTIKFVKASVTAGGLSNNAVRSGLPASTQFAYSFMVRSSVSMPLNTNSMGHMQVLGTSDGGANNHRETAITYSPTTIPANVWTKATIVFSTPAEAIAGETFTFRSFLYYLTYGATYYFSDFQLEKGNISSDWTPAPEDVSAQIETKSKTFTSQPANYAVGDIWKENATIKIAITAGTTYNAAHWTLVGDVTSANTAADVTAVNGTAAATIATGAANGTTANSAVTAGSAIWGRASNINSDGTLNTSKLSGTVTDAQVASGTAWNTAKTLVTDITTNTTLTPFEKQTLKPEYDTILKEKLQATTLATSYGVLAQTYYTDYIAAYDALYAGMNTIMTTNIAINSTIVRATVQGWFSTYYDKSAAFQNGINIQAKTLAGDAATAAATAASLAQAMTQGKMLNKDPAFALGVNGTSVYRTGTWSRVTSATDSMAPPTTSGYMMKLVVTGAPGQGGGFTFGTPARANAKFVVNFITNAPIGTTINFATNGIGTGAVTTWLTSNAGTGKWTEYTYSVVCGATGTFADTNYFYFENATYPFNAYIAMATVYDTTTFESFASQINSDPSTITIDGAKLHFTTAVSMDSTWIDQLVANSIVTNKIQATDIAAGRITSGSISADRILAGSLSGDKITANTIDATRLKIGSGAQGGYINNPRFTAWASTYPDGTALWSAGGISKVTVDTVPMAQFAPTLGAQQGMTLPAAFFASGIDLDAMQYFALECRFRLTVGTNPAGACFLVDIGRQDASSERMQLNMAEAGATLTTNTWYVARKVFKLTDASVSKTFKNISGFLLANYSGAGDAAKTIQFASVNMFQASAQEFLAQSWTNGGTTSINGGMIATDTLSASTITVGTLPNARLSGIPSTSFAAAVQTSLTNAGLAYTRTEDWKSTVDSTYIDGGNIYTGTITAEKIAIGDFTNHASWDKSLTASYPLIKGTIDTGTFRTSTCSIKLAIGETLANFKKKMPVSEGEKIYFEYWIKTDATWNGTISNSKFRIGDQVGGWLYEQTYIGAKTSWTKYSGTYTVPVAVNSLVMGFGNDGTVGNVWIDDIVVQKQQKGELIVDGAITSEKMYAGKVASKNDKSWIDFNNGAFSFADGKLTWKDNELTVNGTVSANNIKGGVISAGNGMSSINMDTGSFNFGNNEKYINFDALTGNLNMAVNSLNIGNSAAVSESRLGTFKSDNVDPLLDFVDDELKANWTALIGALKVTSTDITIQVPGSASKIVISGSDISFVNQNVVVAKITDQKLSINNGLFLENVIMGSHQIKKYGTGNTAVTVFEFMNADNLTI